jgi:hypothetical protein
MDPVKIQGVANWPVPTSQGDVFSFLGFCNFYHHFIHHFANISRPLNHLTGNVPFEWTTECQEAFDKLKSLVTSSPILTMPNYENMFCLETDASGYACGAILQQKHNKNWHPIAFMSKSFTPAE